MADSNPIIIPTGKKVELFAGKLLFEENSKAEMRKSKVKHSKSAFDSRKKFFPLGFQNKNSLSITCESIREEIFSFQKFYVCKFQAFLRFCCEKSKLQKLLPFLTCLRG